MSSKKAYNENFSDFSGPMLQWPLFLAQKRSNIHMVFVFISMGIFD